MVNVTVEAAVIAWSARHGKCRLIQGFGGDWLPKTLDERNQHGVFERREAERQFLAAAAVMNDQNPLPIAPVDDEVIELVVQIAIRGTLHRR